MFIKSEHQICIQLSNEPGRILIGVGSPAPAYMYAQFEISESEARDFAAALFKTADESAKARDDAAKKLAELAADNERLSAITAEAMWEGAL